MRCPALRCASCLLLAMLLLAGCATSPPKQPEQPTEIARIRAQADQLLAQDRPLAAARLYRDRIEQASPERAQRLRLPLIQLLFDSGYNDRAIEVYNQFETHTIADDLRPRARLLGAQVALASEQPHRALRNLPPEESEQPRARRRRIEAIRADAYKMLERPRRALAIRIRRAQRLDEKTAVARNQDQIWTLLERLSPERLKTLTEADNDSRTIGWAALALAIRRGRSEARALASTLADWQAGFADHPANGAFLERLKKRIAAQRTYPDKIGLLLPVSGDLAGPGRAIRDGLMAAYYHQSASTNRPTLAVYDTGAEGLSASAAYDRAVAEGADFVIGPLKKSAVAALAERDEFAAPILSLNYLPANGPTAPEKLYQFGLLPEDEAYEAAETAIRQGHYNALTLLPAGHWGGRLLRAFRKRFRALGGVVLESARYNAKGTDYSRPIRSLLDLDRSNARAHRFRKTIRRNVEFNTRRRQDADVVFTAARPRQGRLLMPQLKFHRAGELPTYATSDVFNGTPEPDDDWDMNGLFFTAIPWTLESLDEPTAIHQALRREWPQAVKAHPRLQALGIDAFKLVPRLDHLAERDYATVGGKTGRLSVDSDGRVHRRLRWALFREGKPVAVSQPGDNAEGEALGADVRERAGGS